MEILGETCPNTSSLSIPNLGSTLEPIIDRFFDKIQKSVIIHIFCTHLHWCNVEYSMPNIVVESGLMPKPSLEPFRVVKIDDFSLLWHCHTTNRSWDRNRFWHPWILTNFRQDLLCTLYLTVGSRHTQNPWTLSQTPQKRVLFEGVCAPKYFLCFWRYDYDSKK